jgi:hypothetical protein
VAEQKLKLAALAAAQAERRLADAVIYARHEGITWKTIGTAIGITAQSAQQRYRKLVTTP